MIEVGSTVKYIGLEEQFHQEAAGFGVVTEVITVSDDIKIALVKFKKIGRKIKAVIEALEEVDIQHEGVVNEITDKVFDDAVDKSMRSIMDGATEGLDDADIDFEKLKVIGYAITYFAITLREELFGGADE